MNCFVLALALLGPQTGMAPPNDPNVVYSPYNWYRSGAEYAQTANPGAYLKCGFSGSQISADIDVSSLTAASVPANQYPVIRYSVDGGPAVDIQLTPTTTSIPFARGLSKGNHQLQVQYVAGYVFLDFWTPVNVLRITGFTLDPGASMVAPARSATKQPHNALFLGDSITNGDDDTATFKAESRTP